MPGAVGDEGFRFHSLNCFFNELVKHLICQFCTFPEAGAIQGGNGNFEQGDGALSFG